MNQYQLLMSISLEYPEKNKVHWIVHSLQSTHSSFDYVLYKMHFLIEQYNLRHQLIKKYKLNCKLIVVQKEHYQTTNHHPKSHYPHL